MSEILTLSQPKASGHSERYRRPKWKKSWDFVLATVGCTVGLGNVWRFPYLCFKNGGGAFLLPFFICAAFIGIPGIILETSLGQAVGGGLTKSWTAVPVLKGLAFGQAMAIFHFNVCYSIIMVWTLKYLVNSFSSTLPWSSCNNTWNTAFCVEAKGTRGNLWNRSRSDRNWNWTTTRDFSGFNSTVQKPVSAATEYWIKGVLRLSPGIDVPGSINTDMLLCLSIMWIAVYLATFRGIKWTSKIVYVTATLPFLLIFIVVVRGVTLDGAAEGLKYFLVPDVSRLQDPTVWIAAVTQVLYTYAIACAVLTTLGSYNKYTHNFLRDSVAIGGMNCLASVAGGIGVFSTLGHMAKNQNTTVDKVASSGPGLAFIVYPQALSLLPLPQIWCVMFFLTLLFLGFDSLFVSQETLMAFLFDNFPILRRRKKLTHAIACFFLACIGLSMITEGGVYVFEIYNNYAAAGWCIFFMMACECVGIAWLYGFDNYWVLVVEMIGDRRWIRTWLSICWKYVAPVTCLASSIYYVVIQKPMQYRDYVYPAWAQCVAILVALSSFGCVPAYAAYKVVTSWGQPISRIRRISINDLKFEGKKEHELDEISSLE